MATKAKIKVFENGLSHVVIHEFDTVEDLLEQNEKTSLSADQIEINGLVILGWDELYLFV